MFGKVKEFFIRREITKLVQEKGFLAGPIAWLNASPGRKRGLAALLLGVGTFMHHMGFADWAQGFEGAAQIVKLIEPGVDVVGLVMAILGFGHAAKRAKEAESKG